MTSDLDLTGYENMDIYGRFYGIRSKERKGRISYLLDMVGLTSRANDLVATYSGGMRRRLEIARVLVHKPKILFLDEPTIGLDPQSRRVVGACSKTDGGDSHHISRPITWMRPRPLRGRDHRCRDHRHRLAGGTRRRYRGDIVPAFLAGLTGVSLKSAGPAVRAQDR
jgi:hypothetical protein